jgi:hypothetical protein
MVLLLRPAEPQCAIEPEAGSRLAGSATGENSVNRRAELAKINFRLASTPPISGTSVAAIALYVSRVGEAHPWKSSCSFA